MTRTTLTTVLPAAHLRTYCALGILLALFAAYTYFLCASVVHVVIRQETAAEVARVNSQIATLEAEYIRQQHMVSEEIALQRGFVAIAEKVFIDRGDTSLVLSASNPR